MSCNAAKRAAMPVLTKIWRQQQFGMYIMEKIRKITGSLYQGKSGGLYLHLDQFNTTMPLSQQMIKDLNIPLNLHLLQDFDQKAYDQFYGYAPPSRKYVPAVFTLDGVHEYEGVYDPSEQWNGWVVPYFSINVAWDVLRDAECTNIEVVEEDKIRYIDMDGIRITLYPFVMAGKKMYRIGGFEWTWATAPTIIRERDTYNPTGL